MSNFFSYIKIGIALTVSYVVVILFGNIFFIGNSPALRPRPDQYLALKINTKVGSLIASFQKNTSTITGEQYRQFMSSTAAKGMRQIAPGTYAATIHGSNVQIVNMGEIPMREYTYTSGNGTVQKIRVGVNQPTPSQADIAAVAQKFNLFESSQK